MMQNPNRRSLQSSLKLSKKKKRRMGAHTVASRGGSGVRGGQGSAAYGVALDGVETRLGEPLHSMNLEDLLRHVLPSDPGGAATSSTAGDSQGHGVEHLVGASSSDIHRGGRRRLLIERPPALREVTLEDFLSRAGAAADGGGGRDGDWVRRNHHQQGITGIYVTRPLAAAPPPPARKRAPAPAPAEEKTVERRQKRMIKNRESAARSRARRQAYTNELENKVSRLEEENERLRKEQQQQLEPVAHSVPQQEQKHQLRRTSSAPF